MTPVRPAFVPDAALSRDEMESLQRDIADAAAFENGLPFDPATVAEGPLSTPGAEPPTVVGVDQAFLDERAVSAVVATRDGSVIERVHAATPLETPYVPGLLSFREGRSILAAFEELDASPDLALFDGSGRIHYRQAGLATHVGVCLDLPSVGVAKSLLCGRPRSSVDGLPEGARVAIEADGDVDAPDGTVIGYAVQSRQYDSGNASINPLYVSPGHRVDAETAAALVEGLGGEYKLPEPTRLADAYAEEAKAQVR